MSWKDRLQALWETSDRALPLDFHVGWISVESGGNNRKTTKLGEVGWYQLSPDELQSVSASASDVQSDEQASFRAGVELMARNAARVPDAFQGSARLGLVKAFHTLPLLAKRLIDGFPGGSCDWSELAAWGRDTLTQSLLHGHNPAKWIRNVDKVMSYVTGEDLSIVEQAEILGDKIGDKFGTEEGGAIALVLLGGLLGLGLVMLAWRLL